MQTPQERFEKILENYTSTDNAIVKDTIDMLCKNGIANGCYQDYRVLIDVVEVLSIFADAVSEKGA